MNFCLARATRFGDNWQCVDFTLEPAVLFDGTKVYCETIGQFGTFAIVDELALMEYDRQRTSTTSTTAIVTSTATSIGSTSAATLATTSNVAQSTFSVSDGITVQQTSTTATTLTATTLLVSEIVPQSTTTVSTTKSQTPPIAAATNSKSSPKNDNAQENVLAVPASSNNTEGANTSDGPNPAAFIALGAVLAVLCAIALGVVIIHAFFLLLLLLFFFFFFLIFCFH